MKHSLLALTVVIFGATLAQTQAQESQITMGNGAENAITTDGATRSGDTFSFPQVTIAGDGWLVMHPFKDGRPDGTVVAGYTSIPSGTSENVSLTVDSEPTAGDRYIVMLHSDANANGEFDFVFINEREVVDKAVFEGTTMIGHVFVAP